MISQAATTVSVADFQQKTAGKQIVLLYHWTPYRGLFLSHALASHPALLYYRIKDDQATLTHWLTEMAEELSTASDGFGSHLREALAASPSKPDALGAALAADLNAQAVRPAVLYLDELDRTPYDDPFERFVRALGEALSADSQVIVCARDLTYQPWYDFVAQGKGVVLGTERRKDDVIFTVERKPRPQLEVYSLGRGYALVNGKHITNWDGALPHNLFFFFIDRPLLTRDEIFATFWPDLSVKEATNVFHVTKRKISERISSKVGSGRNYELTQYSGGFYMPSEKITRHYDVADFKDALDRAMSSASDEEEEKLLTQALALYRAPFLETVNMPWAVQQRDQLRQAYAQALISMGRLNKRRGDAQRALGFFAQAIKETPEREDIHREVMNLYLSLDMVNDAAMQYRALERVLDETLGIGPSRESRELFAQVKQRL